MLLARVAVKREAHSSLEEPVLLQVRLTHRADASAGVNGLDSRSHLFALREGRRVGIKPVFAGLARMWHTRWPHLRKAGEHAWGSYQVAGGAAEWER